MSKNQRRKREKTSKSRSQSVSSSSSFQEYQECIAKQDYGNGPTFAVKTSKVMGRYMVAIKEMIPGSIILQEKPIVVGPLAGCTVQCLACYIPINFEDDYVKCKGCGWPLCSQTCPNLYKHNGHTEIECLVLKECKSSRFLDFDDFNKLAENFCAIVPLRCLILKSYDPKAYNLLMGMETHNDIRRNIQELWNNNQLIVVNKIIRDWGLTEFTEEEVHSVCGILEINAFEIGQNGINIRGLYPTAYLMSHDCVPNTNHSDDVNFTLTVRASTQISPMQPITLSYAYTLQGTIKRREHLLENKFFECKCKRCCDPTELGTYCGALLCPKCKNGCVLSTNPIDPDAAWRCNNKSQSPEKRCPGYSMTAKSMELLLNRISAEVEHLDSNDVKGMEMFLQKYRNVLHPTHYLCLGVKLSLSQVYGKINGYLIHELSDEILLRKQEICKEILKIFDVLEPGFTRVRGVTLYELHAPIMILMTRQFENGTLSKTELKQRLKEVVKYLQEASIILGFEPDSSSEGIMGVAASDALHRIKDWKKIIGRF